MRSRIALVISLIVLSLIIIWMTVSKSINATDESSWPTGSLVCDFPCWQHITPQETSFDEAVSILQKEGLIDFLDENEIEFQINNIIGSVDKSSDGMVDFIILSPERPGFNLSEIVQIASPPERLIIGSVPNVADSCYVFLFMPKSGATVELYLENGENKQLGCQVNIAPDSQASRIVLLGSDIYNSTYWRRSFANSEYITWKGYGLYP